jgi:hypothetical protein
MRHHARTFRIGQLLRDCRLCCGCADRIAVRRHDPHCREAAPTCSGGRRRLCNADDRSFRCCFAFIRASARAMANGLANRGTPDRCRLCGTSRSRRSRCGNSAAPSGGAQRWFKLGNGATHGTRGSPVNYRQGGVCAAAFRDFIRSGRACERLMILQPRKAGWHEQAL